MDEAKLLRKVCRGESKALERLIEQYTAYVTTIVYHIIGSNMSREDVEEVVSDVFVALWQQAEEVHKGKLKGFLSRIARCKAINKLREKSIAVTVEDDELELVREENFPEEWYRKLCCPWSSRTEKFSCGIITTIRRWLKLQRT